MYVYICSRLAAAVPVRTTGKNQTRYRYIYKYIS